MENLLILCLDLFITICAYLLIPAILCILRKELTLSQIKRIAIVNGICVWLIVMIIRISAGVDGTSYAVVLWSYVAYFLMKRFCQKKSDDIRPINKQAKPEVPNSVESVRCSLSYEGEKRTPGGSYRFDGKDFRTPANETALEQDIAPVVEEVEASFPDAISPMTREDLENAQDNNMTQEDEKTERESSVKWVPLFLTILLLVFSVICNISQGVRIAELEKEPDYFVSYPDDYYDNRDKAKFLDESIVFVIEGYGDYFYTYDEMMNVMEDKGEFTFWAYNKELAIALGYIAAYRH